MAIGVRTCRDRRRRRPQRASGDRVAGGRSLRSAGRLRCARSRPLPDRRRIEAGASREPPGPLARVSAEELDRIAAHQGSEVAFGFSQHAVWIYQLEILASL
jgi:hypothetical protein